MPEGFMAFYAVKEAVFTFPIAAVACNVPQGFALAMPTYAASKGNLKLTTLVCFLTGEQKKAMQARWLADSTDT